MNRRLHLLNRRRQNVLLTRHIRAVSVRHIPHQFVCIPKKIEEVKQEEKLVVVEEKKAEPVVEKKEVVKVDKEAKKAEKLARKEDKKRQKQLKKQQKLQDKEDRLNRLIDEPENSIFLLMSDPTRCIYNTSSVDYATLSLGTRVVWNVLKWIAIAACVAIWIAGFINANPFGFARFNFTSTAMLAAKLAIFGYIGEIVCGYLIAFVSKTSKVNVDRARLVSLCTLAAPLEIVLFAISAALIHFFSPIGITVFVASIAITCLLTGYSLFLVKVPPRRTILAVFITVAAFTFLIGPYFSLFIEDVLLIFQNIMNI